MITMLHTVLDTCHLHSDPQVAQDAVSMYRVYYYTDTVEQLEGFYETFEEAEEVAECCVTDYDSPTVEIRDRYGDVIKFIGDEVEV
jgi:hypothetical protein